MFLILERLVRERKSCQRRKIEREMGIIKSLLVEKEENTYAGRLAERKRRENYFFD
jgi:hypothetical protein